MAEDFDPTLVHAILFDIDGTLADTDDELVERMAARLTPLKRIWPGLPARRWARRALMFAETPMNWIYTWWDRTYLDEITAPLFGLLPKREPKPIRLVAGTADMLAALHDRYQLAVVTARSQHQAHLILEEAEIDHYFEVVVTTRTVRRAKPHAAPVVHAAQVIGAAPANCLMVGDTTLDVRAGQSAGAQTVAVLCGLGERGELEALQPSLLLESTPDLVHHLPTNKAG